MTDEQIAQIAKDLERSNIHFTLVDFARAVLQAASAAPMVHYGPPAEVVPCGTHKGPPAPIVPLASAAPAQDPDYEAMEREHLGDPDKKTGIYATHPA